MSKLCPTIPQRFTWASASGGIWRSPNKCTTWKPIFDHQALSTFGDLAIAPSDHNVIWAGTGEQDDRQSSSRGNGVYPQPTAANRGSTVGPAQAGIDGKGAPGSGASLFMPSDADQCLARML